MTTTEKLQQFMEVSMNSARESSNRIFTEYASALDKQYEEHVQMTDRMMAQQIEAETEELSREKNKILSKEQIRIKRELSAMVSELKDKLFVEVSNRLEEYMNSREYQKLLVRQIKEAMEFADGQKITIYVDANDASLISGLESETGAGLTVSQYSFGGGIRAVLPERHILIDKSFDKKIQELKEKFVFDGGVFRG